MDERCAVRCTPARLNHLCGADPCRKLAGIGPMKCACRMPCFIEKPCKDKGSASWVGYCVHVAILEPELRVSGSVGRTEILA